MIKTNFLVNEDEKARILNLHENATKKQYLVLEDDMEMSGPPNLEDKKRGEEFVAKMMKNNSFKRWLSTDADEKLKKIIKTIESALQNATNPSDSDYAKLGKYLRKNPDVESQIEQYRAKNPV